MSALTALTAVKVNQHRKYNAIHGIKLKKILLLLICSLLLMSNKKCQWKQSIEENKLNEEITETSSINYRDYIDNYNPKLLKLFEIEGNFTDSGNREILVFFRERDRGMVLTPKIDFAYCFVFDTTNETIQNVYDIHDYWTLLPSWDYIKEDSLNELGRAVIWRDKRIGYIGDFNENGKEELYFFRVSGITMNTVFYEFDGNEFVQITDREFDYMYHHIIDIDKEDKLIKFGKPWLSSDVSFPIIWNNESQKYEILGEVLEN